MTPKQRNWTSVIAIAGVIVAFLGIVPSWLPLLRSVPEQPPIPSTRPTDRLYPVRLAPNSCVRESVADVYPDIPDFTQIFDGDDDNAPMSCADVLADGQSLGTGMYRLQSEAEAFLAFCEMDLQGGGWTLVAHHQDCLNEITTTEVVAPDSIGILNAEWWRRLRDGLSVGILTVDGQERHALISKSTLEAARCHSVFDLDALDDQKGKDRVYITVDESRACDGKGLDYTAIVLGGEDQGNNDIAGASVFNLSSQKFDVWPYPRDAYKVQNDLLVFVK